MMVCAVWIGVLAPRAEADPAKWQPHIDFEVKPGTDRHLGEADVFLPLAQDEDTLFLGNLRFRIDNQQSSEGNFGLGLRHMLPSGWNLGGYSYFDRRRSSLGNMFNQVTVGAEALSMDWDVRANAYMPIGRTSHNVDNLNTATISGTSVTFRGGEERSLSGFDAELGWRLPVFDESAGQQLRLYAGGYRFSDEKAGLVAGPRGRFDLTFDEVPYLWEGSRFSIGGEIQHDGQRGTQGFASFRLRIPLQIFGGDTVRHANLSPLERRMADPIVRDVDIVSQSGAFGAEETVSEMASGGTLAIVDTGSTTGANLGAAITAAGANSTVVLQGAFTNVNSIVTLQSGQTVMGSGALTVRSPSGRTATLDLGTGTASITGTGTTIGAAETLIQMANNSSLIGITATNPNSGGGDGTATVLVSGVSGVTIRGNTLSGSATGNTSTPIYVRSGASNITITDNTLSATGAAGQRVVGGVLLDGASNVTFSNNTLTATGGNNRSVYVRNTTGLSGSGNVRNAETCETLGVNTGSVSFTDATTCP